MKKTDSAKALRQPFIKQFYKGNLGNFSLVMLATVLAAALNLVLSWLLQQILDAATGNSGPFSLPELTLCALGLLALFVLLEVIEYCSKPRFFRRAMKQYKDYVFGELLKKSIASFSSENTAAYISALSNDANSIETNYLGKLFPFVLNILLFLGAFTMMLWYSPLLTLVAFLLALLPVLASVLTGSRLAEAEKKVSDRNESFLATLKDSLSGFSVIKSFKAEAQLFRLFAESNGAAEDAKCRRRKTATVIEMIGMGAGIIAQMGVFLAGAYLALAEKGVTPGVVLIFLQLMNYVISPIQVVPEFLANRKAAMALIDKLAEAVSANVREEGQDVCQTLSSGITVEGLSFAYEGGPEVLHNINADFEAGKSYAIVGASGSGKSTLLDLLMAGHSGYTGQIRYDGTELRDISSESLYELVSIVQQNVFVFNSSIRDNITMFRAFDKAEVDRAIQMSGLGELIEAKGGDYKCGENGCGLSGGERQRISIARSLLRKTPVLLVDEATAALDKETAFRVTSSILDLEGLTRIVVTHALDESVLRRYDGILVLKDGSLIESGSFTDLMDRKAYFYSLYTVSQ